MYVLSANNTTTSTNFNQHLKHYLFVSITLLVVLNSKLWYLSKLRKKKRGDEKKQKG